MWHLQTKPVHLRLSKQRLSVAASPPAVTAWEGGFYLAVPPTSPPHEPATGQGQAAGVDTVCRQAALTPLVRQPLTHHHDLAAREIHSSHFASPVMGHTQGLGEKHQSVVGK